MSQCVNCLREAQKIQNLKEAKTMPKKSPDLTRFETSALKKFFLKMSQNLKIRQKA